MGAIQDAAYECLKEVGLESLSKRRCVCKLTFFCKRVKGTSLQYPSNFFKGNNNSVYNTRSASQYTLNTFRTRTEKFKDSFFPFYMSDQNKSSNSTKQLENFKKFNNTLMKNINLITIAVFYSWPTSCKVAFLTSDLTVVIQTNTNLDITWRVCEPYALLRIRNGINSTLFQCCDLCHVERLELLNSLFYKNLALNKLDENFIVDLALLGTDKYHKETNRKMLLNCITYLIYIVLTVLIV